MAENKKREDKILVNTNRGKVVQFREMKKTLTRKKCNFGEVPREKLSRLVETILGFKIKLVTLIQIVYTSCLNVFL